MGKSRLVCEYCNKSFEDSHEARLRHNRGRNHKANVKLWHDSFTDQERHASAAAAGSPARVQTATSTGYSSWTPVNPQAISQGQTLMLQNLPPSMHPAPPGAFYYCRADWG